MYIGASATTFTGQLNYGFGATKISVEINGDASESLYHLNQAYLDFLKRMGFGYVGAILTVDDKGEPIGREDADEQFLEHSFSV